MAKIYCKSSYLLRKDTAANWKKKNPVLRKGEQGLETDTGIIKIGDGITAYNNLPDDNIYFPKSYASNSFANALKGSASGAAVSLTDVSPNEHTIGVKVSAPHISDLTTVTVTACGKNLFNVEAFADTIISNHPQCERVTFDGKRCLKIVNVNKSVTQNTLSSAHYIKFNYYSTSKDYKLSFMQISWNTGVTYVAATSANQWNTFEQSKPNDYFNQLKVYSTNTSEQPIYIDLDSFMVAESKVSYEPYKTPTEYTPAADGTVLGVKSLYPTTTLMTDTAGVIINAEYNKDLNKAFAELQQAILSMGGNT